MKKEFIEFLNKLIEANPELAETLMTDGVKAYIDLLNDDSIIEKPILTDNGKIILSYLQENPQPAKAKDIADGLCVSSRTVSGAIRKLVTDEFVEKVSQEPVIYAITEKGKTFKID